MPPEATPTIPAWITRCDEYIRRRVMSGRDFSEKAMMERDHFLSLLRQEKEPTDYDLERIANAMEVSVEYLTKEEPRP